MVHVPVFVWRRSESELFRFPLVSACSHTLSAWWHVGSYELWDMKTYKDKKGLVGRKLNELNIWYTLHPQIPMWSALRWSTGQRVVTVCNFHDWSCRCARMGITNTDKILYSQYISYRDSHISAYLLIVITEHDGLGFPSSFFTDCRLWLSNLSIASLIEYI